MPQLSVNFLDVGMGDSTLVTFPNGKLMLVDLGEAKSPLSVGIDDALAYLADTIGRSSKKKGFPYIDYLWLTHGDADHYNRVAELVWDTIYPALDENQPTTLRIGEVIYGGDSSHYGGLIKRLEDVCPYIHNVPQVLTAAQGPWDTIAGVEVYILSANYPTASKNSQSIVLMLKYGAGKVILPGDATFVTEAHILNLYTASFLKSTALKLGHHGSKESTSEEWLAAVQPKYVFASGDMYWAHPYCEAVERVSTAANAKPHPYCCGKGHGENREYDNHVGVKRAVCLNLAYVVKKPVGEWIYYPTGKSQKLVRKKYAEGYVFGVQWELTLNANGKASLNNTDLPVPPKPGT